MSAPSATFEPTLVEKLFALREVRPFDALPANEATLVARVARPRSFAPGEVIHPGGAAFDRLLVIVGGRALDSTARPVGPILGVHSLLNAAATAGLTADPAQGARALEILKRHFFTLARECPEFVIGLIDLGEHGRAAAAP